jgi:serine/threonine protein kinase
VFLPDSVIMRLGQLEELDCIPQIEYNKFRYSHNLMVFPPHAICVDVSYIRYLFSCQEHSEFKSVDSSLTAYFNQQASSAVSATEATLQNSPEKNQNVIELLRVCSLMINSDLPIPAIIAQVWCSLLSHPLSSDWVSYVTAFLDKHPSCVHTLAECRDYQGRLAIDSAGLACRAVLRQRIMFMGRFRVKRGPCEYKSATCSVYIATDHQADANLPVALKFMKHNEEFQRELESRRLLERSIVDSSDCLVIPVIDSYNFSADTTFAASMTKQNIVAYDAPNLIVMPAADRNLRAIMDSERITEPGRIKAMFQDVLHCVRYLHRRSIVHSDVKPRNLVRLGEAMMIIDLDASALIGKEYSWSKKSSAYMPPEAIEMVDGDVRPRNLGKAISQCVCACASYFPDDPTTAAPIENTEMRLRAEKECVGLCGVAHVAHDIWALGVLFFRFASRESLFSEDDEDNIKTDSGHLQLLMQWTPEFKSSRLSKITDPLMRNLAAQLLMKEPWLRPRSIDHVLAHALFSVHKPGRMLGQEPSFDVFLSYRVAADKFHVKHLYELLTQMGLKVYWDVKCLPDGELWENEFCKGLVQSRVFVPFVSQEAIKHPIKAWQNFEKLTADQASCDNVFLEHRLAIELKQRGLVEKIFPVIIGSSRTVGGATIPVYRDVDGPTDDPTCGSYAPCDLRQEMPMNAPNVQVRAVEEKITHHLEGNCLGTPVLSGSVTDVYRTLMGYQGYFVTGDVQDSLQSLADRLDLMVAACISSSTSSNHLVRLIDREIAKCVMPD